MNDRKFYFKELMSDECQCGRYKKPRYSFCFKCYRSLPWGMQQDLYAGIGGGYEEAYDKQGHKIFKYLKKGEVVMRATGKTVGWTGTAAGLTGLLLMVVFANCAMFTSRDAEICDKPEAANSLICKTMGPSGADFALMLANLEGIKHNIWTKQEAAAFFDEAEQVIDAGNSWAQLTNWMIKKVEIIRDELGVEIIFLSTYLDMPEFAEGGLIDPYDQYLLKTHIQHQRDRVLALF